MVAHCDYVIDEKVIAKEISPCFYQGTNNRLGIWEFEQYIKGDSWYKKKRNGIELNCLVKEVG